MTKDIYEKMGIGEDSPLLILDIASLDNDGWAALVDFVEKHLEGDEQQNTLERIFKGMDYKVEIVL